MSYKKPELVNNEIYHIVIRRIEDKLFFKDIDDHYRGIFSIYEFNNTNAVSIFKRRREIKSFKKKLGQTGQSQVRQGPTLSKSLSGFPDDRDKLVEVLAFSLMPNHLHLLLRQLKEEGISKFMQKLGTGYAGYFKKKYNLKQRGHFFQGKFMAVHIKTDTQLITVFVYIHTNPIPLIEPAWKEKGCGDPEKAIEFLEEKYRWSSYWDYIDKKNFPSVTERDFLLKVIGGPARCREIVREWIKHKKGILEFPKIDIEMVSKLCFPQFFNIMAYTGYH